MAEKAEAFLTWCCLQSESLLGAIQTSDAKSEKKETDVRVLFARKIFTRFLSVAKLMKILVARDGIEPPTPAFSGPLTESPKWFEINGCRLG
jgi:hypothetical protein